MLRIRPLSLLVLCAAGAAAADTVGFIAPVGEVREDVGSFTETVYRVGSGVGAVSVDYATAGGHPGVNYVATSGTLTWADGDSSPRTVTLTILHDGVYDGFPTFQLQLSNAVGAALGQSAIGISIDDIDPPTGGVVRVVPPDVSGVVRVAEDAGSAVIALERAGSLNGAVSVDVQLVDLSAVQGVDHGAPASTNVAWGDQVGGIQTLTIPIIDNAVPQRDRWFMVFITTLHGPIALDPVQNSASVEIVDDDPAVAGVLSAPAQVEVSEAAGSVAVVVQRVAGSSGAVAIDYATTDSSAIAGADYTAVSGTLTWADGDSSTRTVTIPVTNDNAVDGSRSFGLSFSNPVGIAMLDAAPQTWITIADDDAVAGSFHFTTDQLDVSEGSGVARVAVMRLGGTAGAVDVDYTTHDLTAIAPTDYAAVSGTLHWAAGDGAAKYIDIPIVDDAQPEDVRSFYVDLGNPTNGATLDAAYIPVVVQIDDDDLARQAGVIGFAAGQITVVENAGVATFTVDRTGGSAGQVTAGYGIFPGSATCPGDFTGEGYGALVWADGDATPRTISVPIVDDGVPEGVESFHVALSVLSGGASYGAITSCACVIVDDGAATAGTLSFTRSAISVSRSLGTAVFAVQRTGSLSGAVSVTCAAVSVGSDSAIGHIDFQPRIAPLVWNDGEGGVKTFAVPLVDAALRRGTRTFRAVLSAPSGGVVLDAPDGSTECVCTIVDDHPNPAGTLGFAAATLSVPESIGTARIAVHRLGGATGAVSVRYDSVAGSAGDGVDFTPVSGWLAWADGDSADKYIDVPVVNDALAEGDETFTLGLGGPAIGGADVDVDAVTVTILDDDAPAAGSFGFASASTSVVEGAVALIHVARTGGSTGSATVSYALAGDTATAGVDWTAATTGTLSWADGDAADKTIAIAAVADGVVEGAERMTATLLATTGGATLGRATTDVLISDPAPVSAAAAPALHGTHRSCGLGAATAAAVALGLALARRRTLGG